MPTREFNEWFAAEYGGEFDKAERSVERCTGCGDETDLIGSDCLVCVTEIWADRRARNQMARGAITGVLYAYFYNGSNEDELAEVLLDSAADYRHLIDRESLAHLETLLGDNVEESPRKLAEYRAEADRLAAKLNGVSKKIAG